MKGMHLVVPAAALLLLGGCAEGGSVPGPTAPGLAAAGPRLSAHAGPTAVSGEFAAIIDPSTFTFTPRGQNCRLTVDGALVFSGSIEGAATGTTSALVFAPCDEVAAAPPGAHPDVFQSRLHFVGTVNGEPAEGRVMYQGGVQEGGQVEGRVILSNGLSGVLEVESRVAVGGTYRGSIGVH